VGNPARVRTGAQIRETIMGDDDDGIKMWREIGLFLPQKL
jgi:hypothetical protein